MPTSTASFNGLPAKTSSATTWASRMWPPKTERFSGLRPSRRRMSRLTICRSSSVESFPGTRYRCSGSLGSPSINPRRGKDSDCNFFGSFSDWPCRWPTTTDAWAWSSTPNQTRRPFTRSMDLSRSKRSRADRTHARRRHPCSCRSARYARQLANRRRKSDRASHFPGASGRLHPPVPVERRLRVSSIGNEAGCRRAEITHRPRNLELVIPSIPMPRQSFRRTTIGSTVLARYVGSRHAAVATTARSTATAALMAMPGGLTLTGSV